MEPIRQGGYYQISLSEGAGGELRVYKRTGFFERSGTLKSLYVSKGYFSQIRSANLIGLDLVGGIRLPIQSKSSDQRERKSSERRISL